MIIATAGHVDHGKSTLVRALTGVDPDRWAEEKARGLTIDLGFAYETIDDDVALGFVDVPGHIRFINNMLAGVAAVDLGLLVVAADDGIMPQTVEHVAILDLLGVHRVVVAVTKTDRVDSVRVAEVSAAVATHLATTRLEVLDTFAVSGETGEGIDSLKEALQLFAIDCAPRATDGAFRLAVDRSFSLRGAGLVVTGSVFAGTLTVGDEVSLLPQGIRARVRGLHRQDTAAEQGYAGDRCAINLVGPDLDRDTVHRGNWVSGQLDTEPTHRFDADLLVLAHEAGALKHWTPVHLHTGANHVMARVAVLEDGAIEPGGTGLVQLLCQTPLNVCVGDRYIVRDQSGARTLGGGAVLDPYAPARGRAREERVALLRDLGNGNPAADLRAMLNGSPRGVDIARFRWSHNLREDSVGQLLTEAGAVRVRAGATAIAYSPARFAAVEERLTATLGDAHEREPHVQGLSAEALHAASELGLPRRLTDALVSALCDAGTIARTSGLIHLPDHDASLSKAETRLWDDVETRLREAGLPPPLTADLAKALDMPPKELDKKLARLVHLKLLARPAKNRYFLTESIRDLEARARTLAEEYPAGFDARTFRDVSGLGRNLAIELLEYFDRTGFTRRVGDLRVLQVQRLPP